MNFLKELFNKKHAANLDYNEARLYVMKGGDLRRFKAAEIERLKELALNTRDIKFYDILDKVRV